MAKASYWWLCSLSRAPCSEMLLNCLRVVSLIGCNVLRKWHLKRSHQFRSANLIWRRITNDDVSCRLWTCQKLDLIAGYFFPFHFTLIINIFEPIDTTENVISADSHFFSIRITRSHFEHKANGKTFREIAKKMNWLSIDAIFARSHQFKRKFYQLYSRSQLILI